MFRKLLPIFNDWESQNLQPNDSLHNLTTAKTKRQCVRCKFSSPTTSNGLQVRISKTKKIVYFKAEEMKTGLFAWEPKHISLLIGICKDYPSYTLNLQMFSKLASRDTGVIETTLWNRSGGSHRMGNILHTLSTSWHCKIESCGRPGGHLHKASKSYSNALATFKA